jgi:hypothetical protein
MRSFAKLAGVLSLSLAGCLGPLLPLPVYPHTPHAWACLNIACPTAAAEMGGIVRGSKYDPLSRMCECWLEDNRHLGSFVFVDPHNHKHE